MPRRTQLFVSYSRRDRRWLARVKMHFAPLERLGLLQVWSDDQIGAGSTWRDEIDAALTSSRVAVLLVTPAFLASNFIWTKEMPLIMAHREQGMEVLPLIVRPCAWRVMPELERLQARPVGGQPMSIGTEAEGDAQLADFTYELAEKLEALRAKTPKQVARLDDGAGLPRALLAPEVWKAAPGPLASNTRELVGSWTLPGNTDVKPVLEIHDVAGRTVRAAFHYDTGSMPLAGTILPAGADGHFLSAEWISSAVELLFEWTLPTRPAASEDPIRLEGSLVEGTITLALWRYGDA